MKLVRLLPTGIYLVTLLLLFVDAYGSDTKVYRYLTIYSYNVAIYAVVLLVGFRICTKYTILPTISKFAAGIVLPVSLIVGAFLTLWDASSTPNYVYSITKLQHMQFVLVSILSLVVFLVSCSDKWFVTNRYPLIFSGAFVFLGYASLASLFPREVFVIMSQEDGLIEYLQFAALLVGGFFAIKVAYSFYRHGNKSQAVIFLLIFLAFIFIAGDEISWGQRIFGIATPESIGEYNKQDEITVHNLSFFHGLVNMGYILIGLYGACAWTLLRFVPMLGKFSVRYYIPHWSCSAYFAFGALYNLYASVYQDALGHWSESAELMLYTGLMLAVFLVCYSLQD